jgi:hypothetical protein
MKYFQSLPNLLVSDTSNSQIVLKNILVRALLPDSLLFNPLIFYKYDIQDQDTPESIAHKYYGDPYRFWLVLLPNQIKDPLWDWPIPQNRFEDYIKDKYNDLALANNQTVQAYTQGTIKNYIKQIDTTDNLTQTTTTNRYTIDYAAYANTIPSNITTGSETYTVTQTITKYPQYILEYELSQNEAKRNIYLINSNYVTSIENQFQKLMGA